MTELIFVKYKNFSKASVHCEDRGVLMEMQEHFSFFANGYKWMKKFKSKEWDGKIRLLDLRTKTLPAGLLTHIKEFASNRGRNYLVQIEDDPHFGMIGTKDDVSPKEFHKFVQGLNLSDGEKCIKPRSYQMEAAYKTIRDYGRLVLSPTGSGKSLIMYMVMRWVLDRMTDKSKFVIIVPTTTLTKQLIGDFKDYATLDKSFDVDKMCYPIFSGQDKNSDHPVLISTWQSMAKFSEPFFHSVYGIIGDEAHTCTAKVVQSVVDNCINSRYRLGTTGTLDGTTISQLVLEGLFGPIFTATTTKDQINEGNLANLDIKIMKLLYPEDERKIAKFKYANEIKYIIKHEKRNKFISKLALTQEGNTIVMFKFREHGQMLYDMISKYAHKKRKIFLIHGEIDTEYRNSIRAMVENEKDAIIVASIGTFSTGINIKNLHNLIFATPYKGKIKVLQSIGRTLRVADDKRSTKVFDICDDLHWKKRKNFALRHSMERIKHYASEKLKYKIYELKI